MVLLSRNPNQGLCMRRLWLLLAVLAGCEDTDNGTSHDHSNDDDAGLPAATEVALATSALVPGECNLHGLFSVQQLDRWFRPERCFAEQSGSLRIFYCWHWRPGFRQSAFVCNIQPTWGACTPYVRESPQAAWFQDGPNSLFTGSCSRNPQWRLSDASWSPF